MIELDHLVVAARSLDEGARWVAERTGAAPEGGGRHDGFGTHNALLRLGRDVYLEVLAADPAQPPPARPRLFGLDAPATRALLERGPRLLHWVVRTDDLPGELARLAAAAGVAPAEVGEGVAMRRGSLAWTLALRRDGARPPAGLPSVIAWGGAPHPCTRLPDRGVALARLELAAPPASVGALSDLARDPRVALAAAVAAGLAARVSTPQGEALLDAAAPG